MQNPEVDSELHVKQCCPVNIARGEIFRALTTIKNFKVWEKHDDHNSWQHLAVNFTKNTGSERVATVAEYRDKP